MSLKARFKAVADQIPDNWRDHNTLIGVERLLQQIEVRMEQFKDRNARRNEKAAAARAQELRERRAKAKEDAAAKAAERKATAEATLAKAEPPAPAVVDIVAGNVEIGRPTLGLGSVEPPEPPESE